MDSNQKLRLETTGIHLGTAPSMSRWARCEIVLSNPICIVDPECGNIFSEKRTNKMEASNSPKWSKMVIQPKSEKRKKQLQHIILCLGFPYQLSNNRLFFRSSSVSKTHRSFSEAVRASIRAKGYTSTGLGAWLAHGWRMAHGCAMSTATPSGLSRIFLQALMIAHPWQPKCLQPKFLLLNLPDMFCTGQPGQEASFFANLSWMIKIAFAGRNWKLASNNHQ